MLFQQQRMQKNMQTLSKQDLDTVKIPDLYRSSGGNDICAWIDATWEKFAYVKKNHPQVMQGLLRTVINKSGPMKSHIIYKRSIRNLTR